MTDTRGRSVLAYAPIFGNAVISGPMPSAVTRLIGISSAIVCTLKPDSMSTPGERRFSVSKTAPRSM